MSIQLPQVDLSAVSYPYTITPPANLQINQIGYLDILNTSPYQINLNGGSINIPIPPWDHYPIQISQQGTRGVWQPINGASLPITFTAVLLGVVNSTLSTKITITFYGTGETPASTSPRSLNLQSYVPNTVNTTGNTTATNVQDDLRAAGALTVEASVTGDTNGSTVRIFNNGQQTLGNVAFPGQLQINNAAGNDQIQVGPTDLTINAAGSLNLAKIANFQGTNDITENITTGHAHIFNVNSVEVARFNSTGLVLPVGGFQRSNTFTAAVTTTPTLFNHGLGVVPDIVIPVPNGTGIGPFSCIYDTVTLSSTQVKLTGSASFNVTVLVIKI